MNQASSTQIKLFIVLSIAVLMMLIAFAVNWGPISIPLCLIAILISSASIIYIVIAVFDSHATH